MQSFLCRIFSSLPAVQLERINARAKMHVGIMILMVSMPFWAFVQGKPLFDQGSINVILLLAPLALLLVEMQQASARELRRRGRSVSPRDFP